MSASTIADRPGEQLCRPRPPQPRLHRCRLPNQTCRVCYREHRHARAQSTNQSSHGDYTPPHLAPVTEPPAAAMAPVAGMAKAGGADGGPPAKAPSPSSATAQPQPEITLHGKGLGGRLELNPEWLGRRWDCSQKSYIPHGRILVQADRKKTADAFLDTAPLQQKPMWRAQLKAGQMWSLPKRSKIGELAFVQKGPEDKTVYCGYTQMGVDMTEKVQCFRGCKGECENRWECPCPCHVLHRAYDEPLAETASSKMRKEQSEDAK
eukprot:s416_g2.t1